MKTQLSTLLLLTSILAAIPACSGDDDTDGDDDASSSPEPEDLDNVGACNAWLETIECGAFDPKSAVDCQVYANHTCDISDYLGCLSDNFACTDDVPDVSGWQSCTELATCQ